MQTSQRRLSRGVAQHDDVNDDCAELSALRKQSKRRQSSALTTNGEALSTSALTSLYAQCITLASNNKINAKNVWSLRLIDYMSDVITATASSATTAPDNTHAQRLSTAPTSTAASSLDRRHDIARQPNFAKASATLDASIMIYSSRVDDVHKDTYKVLGGLTAHGDEAGDSEDNGEENDADSADAVRPAKRRAARPSHSTIETRLSSITTKSVERDVIADPLFKQMSATFDQGGARGMLQQQIHVGQDTTMQIDTAATSNAHSADTDTRELTQKLDLSALRPAMIQDSKIIPRDFMKQLRDDDDTQHDDTLELASLDRLNEAVIAPPTLGVDLRALHAELDDELRVDADMIERTEECDDNDDEVDVHEADTMEDETAASAGMLTVFPSAEEASAETVPTVSSTLIASCWSGISHWKFKSAARAPTSAATAAVRLTKKRAEQRICFTSAVRADAFVLPPKMRSRGGRGNTTVMTAASLAKAHANASRLLLPDDVNFRAETLRKLFNRTDKPKAVGSAESMRTRRHEHEMSLDDEHEDAADEHEHDVLEPAGSSDDYVDVASVSGADAFVADVTPLECVSSAALSSAPTLSYARTAKRVDVARLKSALYNAVISIASESADRTVSFQSAIDRLTTIIRRRCARRSLRLLRLHLHAALGERVRICIERARRIMSALTITVPSSNRSSSRPVDRSR